MANPIWGFLRLERARRALGLGRGTPPLWWYPSLSLVVAMLAGLGLSQIDASEGVASFLIYEGDAASARSFVSLVATTVASITALTLSITVVTLQLASSQYSPRVLEHYLGDRVTHAVFSLFLGTFSFSIAVLLNVRPAIGEDGTVPGLAVSVLVLLAVASLAGLIIFVYRVTQSIRAEFMLLKVRDRTIDAISARHDVPGDHESEIPPPPPHGAIIRSRRTGFYVKFDRSAFESFEPPEGARIWVIVAPGDYVVEGTPVAVIDGFDGDDWLAEREAIDSEELNERIESWLRFDADRWIESDYSYGIRSLVDVALKALSPAINDPTTATMAISRIGEAMASAADSHSDRRIVTDSQAEVLLTVRSWSETLSSAVRQMANYGASDSAVVASLVRLLVSLAWAPSRIDRRDDIRSVADELRLIVADEPDLSVIERGVIDQEFAGLEAALDGRFWADGNHLL